MNHIEEAMITNTINKSSNIYKKTSDLLNYCLKNRNVGIQSDAPSIIGFINAAYQETELSEKWSVSDFYNLLIHAIETYLSENPVGTPPVKDQTIINFIGRFQSLLSNNLVDYWLIFPLMRANVDNLVQFKEFTIIPEKFTRQEKIRYLASLIDISENEMIIRANHTEKSRSPSFFDYTLFCYKVRHYPSWVSNNANRIALLVVALLRTISNSLDFEKQKSFGLMLDDRKEINKHVLIHTTESSKWGHEPIWANEKSTVLLGNLNWLQDPCEQNKFSELMKLCRYEEKIDRFAYRIRRSILLYSKSVDIQLNNHLASDGFGLELLHLLISAEGILLERENEKRRRLAVLLSELVQVQGKTNQEIYAAIDDIYYWRSDYVHEGNDVFPEYNEDFYESKTLEKVYLLRYVISCLLSNSSKWGQIVDLRSHKLTKTKLPFTAREIVWFSYLREIWDAYNSKDTCKLISRLRIIIKIITRKIISWSNN